ncbi:hypothetical protein J6590_084460 [Homalodisca vitripennis]|nr:hypothetical protein J6590_084460 [Homalodisca vitripennis]
MAMWICLIALVLMLAPVEPGPRYSSRIVDTQAGPVRGVIQNSNSRHVEPVEIFYGIPYAAPPVGARRFTVAQEPLAWVGTRLADTLPPVCPQQLPDITNVSATSKTRLQQIRQLLPLLHRQSEDCLHLNIYVPGSGMYTVSFFVHSRLLHTPY